jgi:Bacterial antitoxin of type II TA system, VapB
MHQYGTFMHMKGDIAMANVRTTLIIDTDLIDRARELSGIQEKTALVRAGLEALIAREAGKRLAALGGTQPDLAPIPRRRSA